MLVALEESGLKASEIEYINTHGTSNLWRYRRVKAIVDVFKEHAIT